MSTDDPHGGEPKDDDPYDDDAALAEIERLADQEAPEPAPQPVPAKRKKSENGGEGSKALAKKVPSGVEGEKKGEAPPRGPTTFLGKVKEHFTTRPDPLTSVVFVLPIFLAYELGILMVEAHVRNGADFFTGALQDWLLKNTLVYVLVHVGVAALLFGLVWLLRRKGKVRPAAFLPVIGESVVYAALLGGTVDLLLHKLFSLGPAAPSVQQLPLYSRAILSLGAGFYEEVVFRVAILGGIAFVLTKYVKLKAILAFLIALGLSSIAFSAYHYLGSAGDALELHSFVFRLVAGLLLGVVFRLRGFAVVVYTHAFYDLFVLVFGLR